MKKILSFLSLSMIAIAVNAQAALVTSNTSPTTKESQKLATTAADILEIKETEFDFGKIPQGKPVTHIFEVINKGKDSLKIQNVQASCGCTTPEWDRNKVYAPGERAKITVGYNAASEGAFSKPITITYNGSLTKQIVIKGDVWKTPTTSAPENKDLGTLKDQ